MATQSISLTIPGVLENVRLLGTSVRALAQTLPIDDTAAFKIELATVEAVTNAICHSLIDNAKGWVTVEIELDSDRMTLSVQNPGLEMNPALLSDAEAPNISDGDLLADFPEEGMGLALIKESMNDVSYHRVGELNEIRMTYRVEEKADND